MLRRYAIAIGFATTVSLSLFFLMQWLISQPDKNLDLSDRGKVIDFVRLKRDSRLEMKKRELPKKAPPPPEPSRPRMDTPSVGAGPSAPKAPQMARPGSFKGSYEVGGGMGGMQMGAAPSDSETMPLVRINPIYPRRALERRVKGWVEVEFTIDASGSVKDPKVYKANPRGVFERAALRAIRKWKYKPKVEGGKAIERPGIKVRLKFDYDEM